MSGNPLTRWRTRPRAERWLVLGGGAVVGVHAAVIGWRRLTHGGDFDVSREFGRRFLSGEPLYAGGLHYPYMPAAAMWFAPLAVAPSWLAFAGRYLAALICLWLTLRLLARMATSEATVRRTDQALIFGASVLLAAHYILRDLDDGGPHLIVLAVLIGGVYCAWRDQTLMAALLLGLGAVLKAPNALLLLLLAWQRRWRLTVLATAATIAWACLPALWMGPGAWWAHQAAWTRTAFASAIGAPSGGALDSEIRVQNQSLRMAIVRNLQSLQASDVSRGEVGTTRMWRGGASIVAGLAAIATLLVAGVTAWSLRAQHAAPQDVRWPWDAAIVLVLSLLLSPVVWTQHLVLLLPGLYLLVTMARTARGLGGPAWVALGLYALLALGLTREVLGRERYLILLTHGSHTLAMLLILALLLARRPIARLA